MKLRSRRSFVATAGVATVAALSTFLLVASPASAADATQIEASAGSIQAAAGTCAVVSFQPRDRFGEVADVPATMTVTLTENPESSSQDVDFCSVGATTPDEAPSYVNGADANPNGTGATQSYTAGPGVTGGAAGGAGGNPDAPADCSQSNSSPVLCGSSTAATSNPSGTDRARYIYRPANGPIRVGVVGLTSGGATINAFFDTNTPLDPNCFLSNSTGDYVQNCGEPGTSVDFKITPGGLPGADTTAVAVATIDLDPANGLGAPNAPQTFSAILRNNQGDTVRGVTPRAKVGTTGANPTASPSCTQSDNNGVSTCTFTGINPGSDQITVWVQKAGGTAGIDANEVSRQTTRTTTKPAVNASEARYLDLTPKTSSLQSGKSATFTATITDVNGAPARQVSVVFTKSSQGSFPAGAQSVTTTTDETGRAFATINTAASDRGTMTVTATINTPNTQCVATAGQGNGATPSTPAGRCSDTASAALTGASPSPTATSTASISPGPQKLTLFTSTPDIQPTQTGRLNANGRANASVELVCYTRPSTTYAVARGPVNLSSSGTYQFTITPGQNTRCYVRYAGDNTTASQSVPITVHTSLSLSAYRDGVRKYHFQGTNLPRRAGQLITLYRWARRDNNGYCNPQIASGDYSATSSDPNCFAVRTATAYTNSSNVWRIDRSFTGSGQFVFQVRTSQTLTNGAGVSNARLTIIH
jgi:hypothetical protein